MTFIVECKKGDNGSSAVYILETYQARHKFCEAWLFDFCRMIPIPFISRWDKCSTKFDPNKALQILSYFRTLITGQVMIFLIGILGFFVHDVYFHTWSK